MRRPYDLRHAALSLWLASGAPPAEVAARAGHSVRVLLTIYAHGIPGCDQIASQQIEQALRPSHWPPAGPQKAARTPGILSVMRPCHSWTQRDTAGPETSAQIRLHASDLRKYAPGDRFHGSLPRTGGPGHPSPKPLTRPDLAHHWPTATGNGLPNRSRTRIRPGSGNTGPGLTWGFGGRCWVRTNVGLADGFTSLKERAGVKGGVPVFLPFPAGVRARRKKGRGQGGAPGWTNDLDAGLSSGSRWPGPGTVWGCGGARPVRSSCPGAGSRLRSSLRVCPRLAAAGAWGGFACGQRDQSDSGRPAGGGGQ